MLLEFLNTISDSRGKISSRRFSKQFLIRLHKEYLWDWFESQIEIFEGYSNLEVLNALKLGYSSPPKCIVCGNNSKPRSYTSDGLLDYCSKECSFISPKRRNKLSSTKQSYTNKQREDIKSKRANTMFALYGVEYNSQRDEVKTTISEKLSKSQIQIESRDFLLDKSWLYEQYVINKRNSVDIADELNVFYGTVLSYCRSYGFKIRKRSNNSLPQKQVFEYIKSIYDGELISEDWEILGNRELDILIPEKKLAIEYNGLYSHSDNSHNTKNRLRHIEKTNRCEEKGIQLLQIREDHWFNKPDIIKSMIASKLNLCDSQIYARKCKIVDVSAPICKDFLNNNHIQGNFDSKYRYGLEYNDELISVMTFSTCRNGSKGDWELTRFCTKKFTNNVGAFSKLLQHFRKLYPGSIISYCDRSYSNGNVYLLHGFCLVNNNHKTPGYSWTDKKVVYSRNKFQKHKLSKILKVFDPEKSEFENMFNNNYRVIYDSGQYTFILK